MIAPLIGGALKGMNAKKAAQITLTFAMIGLIVYAAIKIPKWYKDRQVKEKLTSDYWKHTTYLAEFPNYQSTLTDEQFLKIAKDVDKGTSSFRDRTEEIIAAFRGFRSKKDIAVLSHIYYDKYGSDLQADIRQDFSSKNFEKLLDIYSEI